MEISKHFYQSLIQNSILGYALLKRSTQINEDSVDYEFVEVNKAFEDFFAIKREIIIGKNLGEALPSLKDEIELNALFDELMASGECDNGEYYLKSSEKWLNIQVSSAEQNYYSLIFSDITSLKKNEEDLLEKNEQLKLLYDEKVELYNQLCSSDEQLRQQMEELNEINENVSTINRRLDEGQALAHVGNWEIDIKLGQVWASAEAFKIYEIRRDTECLPLSLIKNIMNGEDRKKAELAYKNLIERRIPFDFEYKIKGYVSGKELYVRTIGKLETDSNDRPVKVIGVIQDITDRVKYEESLRKKNRELEILYKELAASDEELKGQFEEIKRAQDATRILAERYKLATEGSRDAIWDFDCKSNSMYFSDRYYQLLDYTKKEYNQQNRTFFDPIHNEDREFVEKKFKEHLEGKSQYFSAEYRLKMRNGNYKWVSSYGKSYIDSTGKAIRSAGSITDITERKLYENEIRHLAYYDCLTDLPNKVYLMENLGTYLLKYEYEGSCGALIYLDIDNFKFINDTFGHFFGDKIIKIVAERLSTFATNNPKIVLTKFGGDEFVLLYDKPNNKEEIEQIVLEVLNSFKQPIKVDEKSFHVTCSIGVAIFPENGTTVHEILKNSDTAMNKAKDNGKNCCAFYDALMGDEMSKKMEMEDQLRLAIENDEFKLYYQPQVDISSGEIVGFEALIRWFSPVYGLVYPNTFIPLAEENGLIVKIGTWVIERASQFALKIEEMYKKDMHITINVSALQFMQDDFVDIVLSIVNGCGIEPRHIGLELTESTLIDSTLEVISKLKLLQTKGFKIYLDDFGTGYSSLNYLRKLPIDMIKIDKSFVGDIENFETEKKLLKSIVFLAQDLGLKVVAEGVETKEQLDFLAFSNCDMIQGYFVSRPISEKDAIMLIDKSSTKI